MKVNIESLFVTQNNSVLCVGQECEYLLFYDLKCDKKLGVLEIFGSVKPKEKGKSKTLFQLAVS